jgi:hypothetical protein
MPDDKGFETEREMVIKQLRSRVDAWKQTGEPPWAELITIDYVADILRLLEEDDVVR